MTSPTPTIADPGRNRLDETRQGPDVRRKILVTGAAGRVGRVLVSAWRERYRLVCADLHPPREPGPGKWQQADVRDLEAMRVLCRDVDTVVHLAISGNVPDPRSLHESVNVEGARVAIRAALENRCRRVIQASSLAIDLYPQTDYALMKREVEDHARQVARVEPMSIHCLRLGRVMPRHDRAIWPGGDELSHILTHGDLIRIFTASVEAPCSAHFGVFNGVSKHSSMRHPIDGARRAIGFEPADDIEELAWHHYHSPLGVLRRIKRSLRPIWN
ncbi:MAG: NAD(P)-dependent oxidoreductase [Burkholderiaceae bacterium]|nr:NAD(P)-dependent oxidoreductase [Burkholderiaceae bacterium]